jgi:alpha-L-rhamnosidase
VRLLWAESLFTAPSGRAKGERGALDGKYFIGTGDTFIADGGSQRHFETLWWQAGRYLEVLVETQDQALVLESLTLRETRYPLQAESSFNSPDARLEQITPILLRGLQMCAHETYVDCPYYEQLMYVGDTRLETLVTYAISHDDRLPRKALEMFRATRLASGLTRSRAPSRIRQTIPPFSLWWVGMVHDFTLWRGDLELVRGLMPAVRGVIDAFLGFINPDGLVQGPGGWNFMDWVPAWDEGIPPDGDFGASGLINWQMVWTLRLASELESWLGEPELAARQNRLAHDLAWRATQAFWDEERGLLADDLAHRHFSEHTQCLAILSGCLDEGHRTRASHSLLNDPQLTRTTIYFTHYLFETYRQLGHIERLFERLGLWFDLLPYGLKTTPEMPEPTRSDCHGWGSHPLYHYYASLLGIRPSAPAFQCVRIEPQLGDLLWAQGRMVHPLGWIEVDFRVEEGELCGRVELPEGISGELVYQGKTQLLHEGEQEIRI